ncbi:MBOAT family O-acyltransferase [Butyrivibrio sp. VCB2006]|uniref:MBOAT family O-acyltransferase n=1 Tax=Butyrivibrio sp. VCB2006 TaxID=1280679 RepID=UPI00040122D7|nr:MBOAT family O-acyltransferase [Butyrivibrio sp. VCB2006]
MPFKIDSFILLFATVFLFYIIRSKFRPYVLLLASLVFIYRLDVRSFAWVIATSAIVYGFGLLEDRAISEDKHKQAKVIATIGVCISIISLVVLKYSAKWSLSDKIMEQLIIPIGFSYYIFQAISYQVDIYQGKTKAEKNPAYFLLYMCFFPKFVSGPIERPQDFLSQVKELDKVRFFADQRLSIVFPTMLYGFFMKVVMADRLAIYTPKLLNYPHIFGSKWLFAGFIMYTLQIYCDFAGYSALAVGVGRLFGIRLKENFFVPYLTPDISVFWRRWHMSLSTWLRDYVYIPLGGNRKGLFRKIINTLIVFLVCGMWHGVGLSFVIWGLLHGIYITIHTLYRNFAGKRQIKNKFLSVSRYLVDIVVTFFCVALAWIFFGAPSTKFALNYIFRMFTIGVGEVPMEAQTIELGVGMMDRNIIVFPLIILFLDIICLVKKLPFGEALMKYPAVFRYSVEFVMIMGIFLLGIYGPGYNAQDFMYMNF